MSDEQGIPLTLIDGNDHITDAEIKELRNQGVNCDDWDYMLIGPPDILRTAYLGPSLVLKSHTIEQMMNGCFDNKWHLVEFRGKRVALGVAYHS